MKKRLILPGAILGLLLLFIVSCQDVNQTGQIVVKIADEPSPIELIEKANVTITKVEIRAVEGETKGASSENDESDTEDSPFIVLFEGSHDAELTELRNGVTDELVTLEIPADAYDLVRVHVKDASVNLKEYGDYPVNVPSGVQTGVKIFIKPGIILGGGETVEVLLDFNVDRSFVPLGDWNDPENIAGFNFKPVIRAVNRSQTGMIKGFIYANIEVEEGEPFVSMPLDGALVSVEVDGEMTSTLTEEDGSYAILGVPEGQYLLNAEKVGYSSLTNVEVEVLAGRVTEKDFVLSEIF